MRQMVNSEDAVGSSGEALYVRDHSDQKKSYSGGKGKGKNQRGRSKSRGPSDELFCKYYKKTNHVIKNCYKLQNKEKRNKDKGKTGGTVSVASENSSDNGDVLIAFAGCAADDAQWILDSACSYHVCTNKSLFSTYEAVQNGDTVRMSDNSPCTVVSMGTVQIKMFDGVVRTSTEVQHVPSMSRNLISLSTLDMKGYKYTTDDGILKVTKGSLVVIKGDLKAENLYVLRGISGSANVVAASDPETTKIWPMRLGHMSALGLAELSKRGLLDGCHPDTLDFCEHCVFDKHKRVKFSSAVHNTENILDYVHADLWGPSHITSHGGARYMLTIIDDKSRRVWPYFLKQKPYAFESFKVWKTMVEKQAERKLKVLRTDNGMEFCSDDFNSLCRKEGIVRHRTIPYMPQQNGVAECMNRTIISKARCMLSNSGLSRTFWAEAASTACHLINCSPSIAINKKTSLEVWSGFPYDYSHLKVFGCTTYAHVDNGKLEPRAIKGVFLGYGSGVKAYKLWNPDRQKAIYSRNVVFNESAMFTSVISTSATNKYSESISVQVEHVGDVDDHV
jgi:transposase InsO family protein